MLECAAQSYARAKEPLAAPARHDAEAAVLMHTNAPDCACIPDAQNTLRNMRTGAVRKIRQDGETVSVCRQERQAHEA